MLLEAIRGGVPVFMICFEAVWGFEGVYKFCFEAIWGFEGVCKYCFEAIRGFWDAYIKKNAEKNRFLLDVWYCLMNVSRVLLGRS